MIYYHCLYYFSLFLYFLPFFDIFHFSTFSIFSRIFRLWITSIYQQFLTFLMFSDFFPDLNDIFTKFFTISHLFHHFSTYSTCIHFFWTYHHFHGISAFFDLIHLVRLLTFLEFFNIFHRSSTFSPFLNFMPLFDFLPFFNITFNDIFVLNLKITKFFNILKISQFFHTKIMKHHIVVYTSLCFVFNKIFLNTIYRSEGSRRLRVLCTPFIYPTICILFYSLVGVVRIRTVLKSGRSPNSALKIRSRPDFPGQLITLHNLNNLSWKKKINFLEDYLFLSFIKN